MKITNAYRAGSPVPNYAKKRIMREVKKVKLAILPASAISENKDAIAGNDLTRLKESDVANG